MDEKEKDLCDFGDNAEVLMQMARGESFTSLSTNGVWINSNGNTVVSSASKTLANSYSGSVGSKKRSLKPSTSIGLPVANSLQDLTRALTGHPILSHPLSLLKQNNINIQTGEFKEIDSIGLFFYGTPSKVKIESNVQDDMMQGIEVKHFLMGKSIITDLRPSNVTTSLSIDCNFVVSLDNLKVISNSIPPNGKTSWLIPFTVSHSGQVDLSLSGCNYFSDPLGYFYEYCNRSVRTQISELIKESDHVVTLDDLRILVKTSTPSYNISVNFRGVLHSDPLTDLTNFLFYRQSNYSVEVDFETLKISSIKSFVPKFDQQNRTFLLLKALSSKLTKLSEGNYFLSHTANTPFIKIFQ